tara:strand:- start:162 stop:398 length:237 start_codon:yes stop_codon:yes gene_type:complete
MSNFNFGWEYPAGAANDPNAPWNQIIETCETCGDDYDISDFNEDGVCSECVNNADDEPLDWGEGAVEPDSKYDGATHG